MGHRRARMGMLAMLAVGLLSVAPSTVTAAAAASPDAFFAFPSANSTVVGSVGFIDDDEVGYFWSVSRGDSVTETFAGPATITKAKLKIAVGQNFLNSGATVDWTLSINGVDVGRFRILQGFTGKRVFARTFPAIAGPGYTVKIRVTNEVPGGQGSITLVYAGPAAHNIELAP
jgi:hypothetical protein